MRRWTVLGIAALTACGGNGTEEGVVARVDDWTLETDRLAELLVLAQPFPLEVEPAEDLVRHWMGVSALVRRWDAGDALTGDEAARESTWLERREALLMHDREQRSGAVPEPTRADFERGTHRVIAHVLRRVGPETSEEERDLQRRTAERILEGLIEGGSWDSAVARSEDPATAETSGLLGLVAPGELPPPLDRAAFQLEPGQVQGVVESSRGFHILYRPRYEDVAELFARRLTERRLAEAETVRGARLAEQRNLELSRPAVSRVRDMAEEPVRWMDSGETMASWHGGTLPAGTVARYLAALPATSRREMLDAPDTALVSLLEELAVREMRLADAKAAHPGVAEELTTRFRRQHAEEVEAWLETLGLAEDGTADRATVGRYMERVASRQVPLRSLPPLFRAWLLRPMDATLESSRIRDALAEAHSMLDVASPADSGGGGP